MSRITGIDLDKIKNVNVGPRTAVTERKTDENSSNAEDVVDSVQIGQLLEKLPQLNQVFEVHKKIGEGTFSSVYLGSLRQQAHLRNNQKSWFAIKHLVPTTHPARVEHELKCLREIGGKENVIGVELCLRNLDTVVFVMPYIAHQKFAEYVGEMDAGEVRAYARALLRALRHVHSFSVIHRDVKPSNFLYDRPARRYLLVDFGLAQRIVIAPPQPPQPPHHPFTGLDAKQVQSRKRPIEQPEESGAPVKRARVCVCACEGRARVCGACGVRAPARAARAGTQGFRPPEVLLKYPDQTTAVDVWACGVVLLSSLCGRYPLLRARDDLSALAEVAHLTGSDRLNRAALALGRRYVSSVRSRGLCLRKLCTRFRSPPKRSECAECKGCRLPQDHCLCQDADTPAESFREGVFTCGFPDALFGLIARMLDPDPRTRITAHDALHHRFFSQEDSL